MRTGGDMIIFIFDQSINQSTKSASAIQLIHCLTKHTTYAAQDKYMAVPVTRKKSMEMNIENKLVKHMSISEEKPPKNSSRKFLFNLMNKTVN